MFPEPSFTCLTNVPVKNFQVPQWVSLRRELPFSRAFLYMPLEFLNKSSPD
jgi:hypothetical protein